MKPTNTIGWIARILCAVTCIYYLEFAMGGAGLFDSGFALTSADLCFESLLLLSIFFLLISFRFEILGGACALLCAVGYILLLLVYADSPICDVHTFENDFTNIAAQGMLFVVSGIELVRLKRRHGK